MTGLGISMLANKATVN